MPAPDVTAVKSYLGTDSSWSDPEVTDALAAEQAAQAATCRVPEGSAEWPADLAQALKRRVARNLYMRGQIAGTQSAMGEVGVSLIRIGSDQEIRRLEAPWRKLTVG